MADGRADRIGFSFDLAAPAQIRLRILKQGKWVATPFTGPLEPGARKLEWDGAKRVGRLLDGEYEAVVEAIDAFATTTVAVPFSADTREPKVRILQRSPLRLWLSEPATVTLRFGTRRLVYNAARGRRGASPEGAEAGPRQGGCLGRCGQQKQACLPPLALHSAGATACAQIPSNRSGPSARPPAGLREIERSDSGEESEGRRCAGARRALRAACPPGGAPGSSRPPRPGGRARRVAGGARQALRQAAAVSRRVVVLDLAAPVDGQRVPGRRSAPGRAPLRAAGRGPPRSTRR